MKLVRRMYMTDGGAGGSGGAGGGTGTGTGDGGAGNGGNQGAAGAWKFEDFAGKLQESDRTALASHIEESSKGLKNALEAERASRKQLEKDLADARKGLDANSEAAKQLDKITADLKLRDTQATFYEAASAAGCRNLKLAWAAASLDRDKYFKRDDSPDMEAIKADHPELFAATSSGENKTNGGTGSSGGAGGSGGGPNAEMNAAIRAAAGYR